VQYFDLMSVFVPGLHKARINAKKADQVAPAWTNPPSEAFDIASRKRSNPPPVTAQNMEETGGNGIFLLFAGEDRLS
jgi:hypothetical protein